MEQIPFRKGILITFKASTKFGTAKISQILNMLPFITSIRENCLTYSFYVNITIKYKILSYANVLNFIGDDIGSTERNAEVLLNVCKDIGLAVHKGKTKYMVVRRRQGMMTNEHIAVRSNSYENVKTFKYFGSLLTNQNSIHDK